LLEITLINPYRSSIEVQGYYDGNYFAAHLLPFGRVYIDNICEVEDLDKRQKLRDELVKHFRLYMLVKYDNKDTTEE
jgi:hypothetical protein